MSGAVAAVSGGMSSGSAAPSGGAGSGSSAPGNGSPSQTQAPIQTDSAKSGAPQNGAQSGTQPPKPEAPQRFKYKNKDAEVDMDPADVWREIQKARHYDKTRGESEAQRKAFEQKVSEFEARMQALQKDPLAFFDQSGIKLTELAQMQAAREAELNQLSPELRELAVKNESLARELQQLKDAAQQRELSDKQAAETAAHQELVQNTVRTLDEAIKLSGYKRSGELVKLYSEVMELAEHNGEPPLSTEQLVAAGDRLQSKRFFDGIERATTDAAWRARNAPAMQKLAGALFQNMQDAELLNFVGRENALKLTRAALGAYRKNPIPTVAEPANDNGVQPQQPKKTYNEPQSMYEMLDRLQSR